MVEVITKKHNIKRYCAFFVVSCVCDYLLPALFFGLAVEPFEVAWPADFELDELLLVELDDLTVDELLLLCVLDVVVVVMHEVSIASDTNTAKTVVIRFSFIVLMFLFY